MSAPQPVPRDVLDVLERVARRWAVVPVDRARDALPTVHALLSDLVDPGSGPAPAGGTDLSVAQLRVLVHDAYANAPGSVLPDGLPGRLAAVLRALDGPRAADQDRRS